MAIYRCNLCGEKARTYGNYVKRCTLCGIYLCKRCSRGDLCINCYDKLDYFDKKKYNRVYYIYNSIIIAVFIVGIVCLFLGNFQTNLYSQIAGISLIIIIFLGVFYGPIIRRILRSYVFSAGY